MGQRLRGEGAGWISFHTVYKGAWPWLPWSDEALRDRRGNRCNQAPQAVLLTLYLQVALLGGPRRAHGVRLAGTRLAVRQQRDIITLGEGADAVANIVPDALLRDVGGEDTVEDKELATLGRVDGEARIRRDLHHGPLESLGNEVEAGVARLEGRADTDSWREDEWSVGYLARAGGGVCRARGQRATRPQRHHAPTLTEVRPSSSEERLPPPVLLPTLMRLWLRGAGRTMALMGRCCCCCCWGSGVPGEAGGEVAEAMVSGARGKGSSLALNCGRGGPLPLQTQSFPVFQAFQVGRRPGAAECKVVASAGMRCLGTQLSPEPVARRHRRPGAVVSWLAGRRRSRSYEFECVCLDEGDGRH